MGDRTVTRYLYFEVIVGYGAQICALHADTLLANEFGNLVDLVDRTPAKYLYDEVIAGYTSQLGAQHIDTFLARLNLANLLKDLGDHTIWIYTRK